MNCLRFNLVICFHVFLLSGCAAYNARVIEQLNEGSVSESSERLLLLKLDNERSFPVRYAERGHCLFLGAGGNWWREVEKPRPVSIVLRGRSETWQGQAFPKESSRQIVQELRDRWPRWIRNWVKATLVVLAKDNPKACLRGKLIETTHTQEE